MCEACLAEVKVLKNQPLEGWFLGKSFKDSLHIKKGQWTLTIINSPEFIIEGDLIEDPLVNMSEEEIDSCREELWEQSLLFDDLVERNRENFYCYPTTGHFLVESCMKAGCDLQKDGSLMRWLLNYLAKWVSENKEFMEG